MSAGALIAVVGPSGVGKDSVIAGMVRADKTLARVQRVITRAPGLGGEDYVAVSPVEFDRMRDHGAFCLDWHAHALRYGIPSAIQDDVRGGKRCVANLSRAVLTQAAQVFETLQVLNITATPETLAQRLSDRGRETAQDIDRRLARAHRPLPAGLHVTHISNDGPLQATVAAAIAALQTREGETCDT